MEPEIRPEMTAQRLPLTLTRYDGRLQRFIVTPDGCSDMAGSPIASLKAER
jgi:hypothetical protein